MVSNWRQKQKQELKRLLYETALQLFESQGFDSTTVRQITEQVQVAKGTFFNHFATKEHVIQQWYSQITFDSLAAAKDRLDKDPDQSLEKTVSDLFSDMAGRATAHPELLIAKAQNNTNPLLLDAEVEQGDVIEEFLLERCRQAKEKGEVDRNLDEAFFVGLLGTLLTGSSRAWVRRQYDFPSVIRRRVAFVFKGAGAELGK